MAFRNLQAPLSKTRGSGPPGTRTPAVGFRDGTEGIPVSYVSSTSFWRTIGRYKRVILASAILGAIAAFIFSSTQPPRFVAAVAVEVEDFNDSLNASGNERNTGSDAYLQTEIESLTTTSLLQRVSDKLQLETRFRNDPEDGPLDKLRGVLRLPVERLTPHERALRMLRDGMQVITPKNSSRIVRISFSADNPQFAAKTANTIAEQFIDQNLQLRLESTRQTNGWVAQQIDDLRTRFQASEQALRKFTDSSGINFNPDNENITEAKLKRLQDELSRAQAERIEKQSRHEVVARGGANAVGLVIDTGTLHEYQSKLAAARQKLAELESVFTANHPKVMQARADVAAIEASIENERQNTLRRITSDFETAQRREQLLTSEFNAQTRIATARDAQAARYTLLKNEVDTNKQLYDAMVQKVKGMNIASSALPARNIVIIDPAQPPSAPVSPRPVPNSGIGMVSGLLIAAVFALAREYKNQPIRIPGLTQSVLHVPELGAIPAFREQSGLMKRAMSIVPGRPEPAVELATLRQADSLIADSYRAVVASLLFGKENSDGGQVLGITSAMPGEGKTTALCNLAIVLTRINRKVVVIDADFRKPRLSTLFGVGDKEGLADFLRTDIPVTDDGLLDLAFPSTIPRVPIIAAGRGSAGDVDLFHSPRLAEIIEHLRTQFDFILIDTPPVIPVPDARIVGQKIDGVLIVCRASITNADVLRTAVNRLQEDGTRVIGTILNDFNPNHAGKYWSNYSNYYGRTS
jgi:succinoglycan biosynthesis transport protein ExoP